MDNSFLKKAWRSKEINLSKEELDLSIGECNLLRIERKFIEVITNFIRGIFNYEKINVVFNKTQLKGMSAVGYSSAKLESENGHTKFHFAIKAFNGEFYEFSVTNIPATTDSIHIKIFFNVLMQFISYFYECIENDMKSQDAFMATSQRFVAKSDIWLYNIERTIIIEYIYALFNNYNEQYSINSGLVSGSIRYDLDTVISILDFAFELSTKKVENKEIYCGFIFHDECDEVKNNSVRSIQFENQFDFADFTQLKNYLEVSNGQNIFFSVTNNKISHLFITREKLNEIYFNPIGHGKTFQNRPLIMSIQGSGKIYFLEGRSDQNRILLQIINSKPVIRDNIFIEQFIYSSLKDFIIIEDEKIKIFSKWIMSLSQKKHGASLIFHENAQLIENSFVKSVKVIFDHDIFTARTNLRHDLSLLDSIVNPDGAVIFGNDLMPTHISTILPIGQTAECTSGGARHNSVSNFTRDFGCFGIVISEDGPITIFKNGNKLIKF